ncbi:MAG: hypothetical protein EOP70_08240 [Variovorax sp.]|nr:MAG: hypothetical protein EOP70_08240 [Variovorax sp.]
MRIACLAWGSLLWKTGPLKTASEWHDNGPDLPIEFARVSDKGELSTVIREGSAPQRTWWALLDTNDIDVAREMLREREQIAQEHPEWLGSLPSGVDYPCATAIGEWLARHDLDAVVWTALPPRYADEEGRAPTADEAVDYLDGLSGDTRSHAEDYVRQIPPSLATAHRGAIETRLGWTAYAP